MQRAREDERERPQGEGDLHRFRPGRVYWCEQDSAEVPGDARAEWNHGAWELLGVRWLWPRGGQAGPLFDVLRLQRNGDQRGHARAVEQFERAQPLLPFRGGRHGR